MEPLGRPSLASRNKFESLKNNQTQESAAGLGFEGHHLRKFVSTFWFLN